jgi:hypothetical protein
MPCIHFPRHWHWGVSLLSSSATSGRADETFLCQDGSSVTIDGDNRAAMQGHPCLKAWFANDRARRQAKDEQGSGSSGPDVHRYTVNRAVALRDLKQRPRLSGVESRPNGAGPLLHAPPARSSARTSRTHQALTSG